MLHAYKCSMCAPLVARHTSRRQSSSCHTVISMSGVMFPHFFPLQRHPVVWNCWYQRLMLLGDGGSLLNFRRNARWTEKKNWFMLHKLQHTQRFPLRSRHYRCVTSQTEREEGSGIAHEQKTWTPVSFHVGNLLLHVFLKPWWQIETAPIILIHPVLSDYSSSLEEQ